MDSSLLALLPQLPTLEQLVSWSGYVGLFAIVFSETGLLVGFFLPGDSLLVTAGLLIASGKVPLNITILGIVLSIAAVTGNATGYWIGYRAGQALYHRPQSRFFRRDLLLKTKEFYEKYGGITIILAQFMPFARTFAPVVAGIGEMRYKRFAMFNIVAGVGWIHSMTLLGYYLGRSIPGIEHHIEYIIIIIVAISVSPLLIKYLQHRLKKAREQHQTP